MDKATIIFSIIALILIVAACVWITYKFDDSKTEQSNLIEKSYPYTSTPQKVIIEYSYHSTSPGEFPDEVLPEYVHGLDEFNEAACMIAQTLYGECRGLSTYEQSLVVWTILNRVDDPRFKEDTICDIITAPNQFHGYKPQYPVDSELYDLAVDVLMRWSYEKYCIGDVGRTLPKEYVFFAGHDHHNWFRTSDGIVFNFDTIDPYGDKDI